MNLDLDDEFDSRMRSYAERWVAGEPEMPPLTLPETSEDRTSLRSGRAPGSHSSIRRSRRRLIQVGAPVLAAAVIAAIALVVVLTGSPAARRHVAERGQPSTPRPKSQGPVSTTQLRRELAFISASLIAEYPAPSNSHAVDHLPKAKFPGPGSYQAGPPAITRSRFWIVPASTATASVAHELTRHRPSGLTLLSTVSVAGTRGARSQLFIAGARWQPLAASVPAASVSVTVAAIKGGGIGVRVDASTYLEPRNTAQTVPSSVTGAQLEIRRTRLYGPGRHSTVERRSLDATHAQALAAVVNHLPVYPAIGLNVGCPVQQYSLQETMTFAGPGPTRTVEVTSGECATPRTTTRVGTRTVQPPLDGSHLITRVHTAAGLPTDYGSH